MEKRIVTGIIGALLIIAVAFTVINFAIYLNRSIFYVAPNITKVEKGYIRGGRSETLYGFKDIDIDENGRIYIGCHKRIIIFDNSGEMVGEFCFEFNNFSFKIVDGNYLHIISGDQRLTDETEKYGTYELVYNIAFIEGADDMDSFIKEKNGYETAYNEYARQNGYEKNYSCANGGKTYKYENYNKLAVVGDESGQITLDVCYFPLPMSWCLWVDAVLAAVLITVLIVGKKKAGSPKDNG